MSEPFDLPTEDIEYLDATFSSKWTKVSDGNGKHGLLIRDFPVPDGYTANSSTFMLLIPVGYPGSMLDMFYFCPPLVPRDGGSINGLASETHFGQQWQRWSRHYKWRPGHDSIVSHIEYVTNELRSEVTR